jgi:hypothetical protein
MGDEMDEIVGEDVIEVARFLNFVTDYEPGLQP